MNYYFLLKKQKKICDEELAKLVDEERNRGEKVLEILDVLISKGFKFDKESYDEIKVYKDCRLFSLSIKPLA